MQSLSKELAHNLEQSFLVRYDKMKMAFIFNIKLTKYGEHYYSTNLGKEVWESRYLNFSDSVILICRCREASSFPNNMLQVDSEKVKVFAFKDEGKVRQILNYFKEKEIISKLLADCDYAICRGAWGVTECRKQNKPYLIEVVGCVFDALWNYSLLGKVVALPNFLIARRAIWNAKYVLYVTQNFLQSRYPTKGRNIGVSDVICFPESKKTCQARYSKIKELYARENMTIKIGTVAAVNVSYKGQRFVIKAMQILAAQGVVNVEYHLAGGGSPDKLRKYAKKCGVSNRVVFHGAIIHDNIKDFLDCLDIYVQPSLQEGLPRAVVEAMSRGVPCIGTNCGGTPELVNPKFICKKGRYLAKDIASKIRMMINSDAMMLEMAKYSFDVASGFDKDRQNDIRNSFYSKFIESFSNNEL